jgi:hypothetical protein
VKKVFATKDTTTMVGGMVPQRRVNSHVDAILRRSQGTTSTYGWEHLRQWLTGLRSGVTQMRVGAENANALQESKRCTEGALVAMQYANQGGVIQDTGAAMVQVATPTSQRNLSRDQEIGYDIVLQACREAGIGGFTGRTTVPLPILETSVGRVSDQVGCILGDDSIPVTPDRIWSRKLTTRSIDDEPAPPAPAVNTPKGATLPDADASARTHHMQNEQRRIVNTGFQKLEDPHKTIPPYEPLRTNSQYYFWLDISEVHPMSIEVEPDQFPVDKLPREADLAVVLFPMHDGLRVDQAIGW